MKYVFYIETEKKLIGDQLLFVDLAAYIADTTDHEIYYANNKHEEDLKRHRNSKLNFIDINECDFNYFEDAVFFTPVNYLIFLVSRIKHLPKAKIFCYVYDKKAVQWLLSHINCPASDETVRNMLDLHNACSYLNKECAVTQNKNEKAPYIPLYSINASARNAEFSDVVSNDKINICYYDDITESKFHTLNNFFKCLKAADAGKDVDIHIMGTIVAEENTDLFNAAGLKYDTKFTNRLILVGKTDAATRRNYLINNVDIIVACGRNAVEAASLGIPVLIPVSENEPFEGNNFVYFSDAKKFIFNWDNRNLLRLNYEVHTLKTVLRDVYYYKNKSRIGKDCFDFYNDNCSMDSISRVFFDSATETTLTVAEVTNNAAIASRLDGYEKAASRKNVSFMEYVLKKEKNGGDDNAVKANKGFKNFFRRK